MRGGHTRHKPDRLRGYVRQLGELEGEVMNQLWSAGEACTVREVLEGLRDRRDLAYTTVLSTMGNLLTKGYLTRVSEGRAHRYEPTMSRAAYAARLMSAALTRGGDADRVLLHFVSDLPEPQQVRLRDALGTSTVDPADAPRLTGGRGAEDE